MTKTKLKLKHKILITLLVLSLGYLAFLITNFQSSLMSVHNVSDKYTQTAKNADLIVLDFSKYGCNNCINLHPVLKEAIKQDGAVRYIPRPVTFGEAWAFTLTTSAYAAAEQGKFIEMHNAIFENWPIEDKDTLLKVASSIGLDTIKLEQDMLKPEIKNHVKENDRYFEAWGTKRTPTLLIGKKRIIVSGDEYTPAVETLLQKFNEIR